MRQRDVLELSLASNSDAASGRAMIRDWVNSKVPRLPADEVVLGIGEAVSNALEHGRTPVAVAMEWSDDSMLEVRVGDVGTWQTPAENPSRGFGLSIMNAVMDSVTVDTTAGTTVTLRRRIDP